MEHYTDNSNDRPYSNPNKEVKQIKEVKTSHHYLNLTKKYKI